MCYEENSSLCGYIIDIPFIQVRWFLIRYFGGYKSITELYFTVHDSSIQSHLSTWTLAVYEMIKLKF